MYLKWSVSKFIDSSKYVDGKIWIEYLFWAVFRKHIETIS